MVDTAPPKPEAPAEPKTDSGPEKRSRRRLWIVLGIVLGIVVYALAFEYTEVDFDKTESETRQASLTRILRALAHPELTTYDTEQVTTALDVAVPCGAPAPDSAVGSFAVVPACGAPGDIVTVSGADLEPGENVVIGFVPDSEFDVSLTLARVQADDDGAFSVEVELPERESEITQTVEVVTDIRLGTWRERVEVWTDTNENGVLDDPIVQSSGEFTVVIDAGVDGAAGVALIDAGRSITQFVSTGDGFVAISGIANGETAVPFEEATSDRGDPEILSVAGDGSTTSVVIGAREGTDLTGWRVSLYDATTAQQAEVTFAADQIELSPRISETSWITLDKIIETVFLALVATTAGLLLAVPLSFVAARNIMRDITSSLTNLALGTIAAPLGAFGGFWVAGLARDAVSMLGGSWVVDLVGTVALVAAIRFGFRWIAGRDEDRTSVGDRFARSAVLVVTAAAALFTFFLTAELLVAFGEAVQPWLITFDFLGAFFATMGEILDRVGISLAALTGLGFAVSVASRLGYAVRRRVGGTPLKVLDILLSMVAWAVLALLVEAVLDWLYRFSDPAQARLVAIGVGAAAGLVLGVRGSRTGQVNVGLTLYYIARTIFNTLRAIEPLVMAIVFVVWVGIGPFAGALALTLHTTAALAKLYSEQVESIAAGPIEAVRATGATRLQTIVYAVVPQIVPPYISFTMYRWDINVRMSTILGFVGAGGIGFILQQNVNLLQYRAASVQMLAIAIVVATMDYVSSRLRERFV